MIGYIYINGDNSFMRVGFIRADDYSCLPDLTLGIPTFRMHLEKLPAMLVLRRLKKLGEAKKLRQAKILDLINSIDKLFE
jgi:hypothetical protein